MLATGTPVFLLVPDSSKKRVLNPGKVSRVEGSTIFGQFEEAINLAAGAEIVVFAMLGNKFMQQGATVAPQPEPVLETSLAFQRVGEAVSAESRQTYRVSVAAAGLKAKIVKEADCLICDISPEGFAAITKQEHKIGSNVPVNFTFEGQTVASAARVQTVKSRSDGKFRYGFLIAEKGSPSRKALATISAAMQRQQLRNLAAA